MKSEHVYRVIINTSNVISCFILTGDNLMGYFDNIFCSVFTKFPIISSTKYNTNVFVFALYIVKVIFVYLSLYLFNKSTTTRVVHYVRLYNFLCMY
jgi:hypothetical protein